MIKPWQWHRNANNNNKEKRKKIQDVMNKLWSVMTSTKASMLSFMFAFVFLIWIKEHFFSLIFFLAFFSLIFLFFLKCVVVQQKKLIFSFSYYISPSSFNLIVVFFSCFASMSLDFSHHSIPFNSIQFQHVIIFALLSGKLSKVLRSMSLHYNCFFLFGHMLMRLVFVSYLSNLNNTIHNI